ncbi:MAG: hypothetical protein RLZZ255_1009, partial [Cyanobacteriota bacterium]
MTWLLEPLSHAFMVKALLVSALVGGVCGLLSCYMTLKGLSLIHISEPTRLDLISDA